MAEQAGNVFKQQIRRVPGFSQPGKLKEQGPSWVAKSSAAASNAESLAGESPAQQVKFGHGVWVGVSCIVAVPLSFAVKQCAVALVGLFVQLAVSHADKISGAGQPLAEAANAGEHINKSNGFGSSPRSLFWGRIFLVCRLLELEMLFHSIRVEFPQLLHVERNSGIQTVS